jgi:acetoin utilization deacetylase AcuC-like enzyme
MKLFFAETQLAHQPKQYMVHGRIVDPFENPNRAQALIAALEPLGLQRADPGDFGRRAILDVHEGHYVAFLEEAYERFMELPNHGAEVLPNVHPYRARAWISAPGRARARPGFSAAPAGTWAISPVP